MRTIAALQILRDHVIRPIIAGIGLTRLDPPTVSTALDQQYERLRLDMQPVFQQLGIAA